MADCLFCGIVSGEIPSTCVYQDEFAYAFLDIDPQAPTHIVVVPKQHMGSVSDISDTNGHAAGKCLEAIATLTREQGIESYRVVSNVGEEAGQTVLHLHFHVLAGRVLAWPPG